MYFNWLSNQLLVNTLFLFSYRAKEMCWNEPALVFHKIAAQGTCGYDDTRKRGGAVMPLQIVRNDIATMKVDVIVNAATRACWATEVCTAPSILPPGRS